MTTFERFEGDLPMLLEELAPPRTPDYLDTVFGRTAGARQRPVWTFPERWLPMSTLTERMVRAPRVPWRPILVLVLLLVALAAAALYVGSLQQRLPTPFGPAANGLIPYVSNGDLYVGDPVTGVTRLLVGGPEADALPQFSPDGTRVAFNRAVDMGTATRSIDIYVVGQDGSDLVKITPEPIDDTEAGWKWIGWTPDGRQIAVVHAVGEVNQLDLLDATGSGPVKTIATAAGMDFIRFRPPDGREILYRALVDGKWGLFAMDADGARPRSIVQPTVPAEMDFSFGAATYSADGSRIFYQHGDAGGCCQLWVVNADGTNDHAVDPRGVDSWSGEPAVSPDGRWIAYWHNFNDRSTQQVSVRRADGTGPEIRTGPELSAGAHWTWAPDSSKILMIQNNALSARAYLLDPVGGPWTTVPWGADADLDWQRVAPAP